MSLLPIQHYRRQQMSNDWFITLLFAVALFMVVCGFIGISYMLDKAECERFLPRNVECTWQAPEAADE